MISHSNWSFKVIAKPVSIFVRGKRTKSNGALSSQVQRVVTQLSVISASRKQPKMLKLSREDLIKHDMIQACWSQYQSELRKNHNNQMKLQYQSAKEAMDLLKEIDQDLFDMANIDESGKKFPLELRVPTNYPPNNLWYYDYKKKD